VHGLSSTNTVEVWPELTENLRRSLLQIGNARHGTMRATAGQKLHSKRHWKTNREEQSGPHSHRAGKRRALFCASPPLDGYARRPPHTSRKMKQSFAHGRGWRLEGTSSQRSFLRGASHTHTGVRHQPRERDNRRCKRPDNDPHAFTTPQTVDTLKERSIDQFHSEADH